jgi:hypothetical protein
VLINDSIIVRFSRNILSREISRLDEFSGDNRLCEKPATDNVNIRKYCLNHCYYLNVHESTC